MISNRLLVSLLLVIALTSHIAAQTSPPRKNSRPALPLTKRANPEPIESRTLPVQRVVLYKNGVGYFEHSARVRGHQDVAIDFTTAQLNDVLKSLTIVDPGGGHITSVRYNSIEPLEERLRALRLPLGPQVTRAEVLAALRGTRVEVKTASGVFTGKLLSVEKAARAVPNAGTIEVTQFGVLSDAGEMRSFEVDAVISVRIADGEVNADLGRYLSALGASRSRDLRRMIITAAGSGERELAVSYISEVPIWKSTYRLILPEKTGAKATLQGWAIVDNTLGSDWKDVELSLVAGAPQSFIQELSQAYYSRRPVVPPPKAVELTPQTHEATLIVAPIATSAIAGALTNLQGTVTDPQGAVVQGAEVVLRNEQTGLSATTRTDASGRYQFNAIQAGNSMISVSSQGFRSFQLSNVYLGVARNNEINATLTVGTISETVEVRATAPTLATSTSSMVSSVSSVNVEVESRDVGDLYRYDITKKITIGRNQSALVPILQQEIEAEPVTVWNREDNVPRRAVWIKNTSGLTLDGGTFDVMEGNTFAGEGTVETVKPQERRLFSYAADTGIHIRAERKDEPVRVRRVRIAKGILMMTDEEHDSVRYVIRNADANPRDIVIEHPAGDWELVGDLKPEESSASFHRFRLPVAARSTAELTVKSVHREDTKTELNDIEDDALSTLIAENNVSAAFTEILRKILEQKNAIAALEQQIKTREKEVSTISSDQARLRENMKALKGSAEERSLIQRYTAELNSQEDRLAALRRQIDDLQDNRDKAENALEHTLQELTFDQSF